MTACVGYETPQTHISAAFLCIMDDKRIKVLKALLRINKQALDDYEVPPKLLAQAGVTPISQYDTTDIPETSLCMAALYLGNIKAFQILVHDHQPTEGLLHLAAFLALPEFVELFLRTPKIYDPDLQHEEYGNLIPLAVAIETIDAQAPSKVANLEATFMERRTKIIQLLAPKTDTHWCFRGKSVVHYALHKGPETTETLLTALNVRNVPGMAERFQYVDKQDEIYDLHKYVDEIMTDVTASHKEQVKQCLLRHHILPSRLHPGPSLLNGTRQWPPQPRTGSPPLRPWSPP